MGGGGRRRGRHLLALVAVATSAGLVAGATPTAAQPTAPSDDYPDWSEIEAARADASAAAEAASRVSALLDDLRVSAAVLQDEAIAAQGGLVEAEAQRDAADRAVEALTEDATVARTAAERARARAGAVAAQTARADVGGIALWLAGDDDGLLDRLGALDRLAGQSRLLLADAARADGEAAAVTAQGEAAAEVLAERSDAAAAAARAAEDAERAAAARLAEEEEHAGTLLAQLAALRGTTAALEQERQEGRTAEAAYAAQRAAAERAAATPAAPPATTAPAPPATPAPTAPGSSSPTPPPASDGALSPAQAQAYARTRLAASGRDEAQATCLVQLWNRESGWRWDAVNRSSGAYGIPQAYPGSRMASAGSDWRTNARTQIDWGLGYIDSRYGSPCAAWEHSNQRGWY